MLNKTADLFQELRPAVSEGTATDREKVIFNAIFESFLVHFRCLAEFSLGRLRKSDIRLEKFAGIDSLCGTRSHWGEDVRALKGSESLEPHLEHVDKRLAHLTNDRTGENLSWDTCGLALELNAVLLPFIEAIPEAEFPQDYPSNRMTKLLRPRTTDRISVVTTTQTVAGGNSTRRVVVKRPTP